MKSGVVNACISAVWSKSWSDFRPSSSEVVGYSLASRAANRAMLFVCAYMMMSAGI